jgi:hypothetical protein
VSDKYMNALRDALSEVGIRGRLRTRILVELEDHLRCDPNANLGSPLELAREFADEHGTSRARRGTIAAFGALALAGVVFAVAFLAATNFGMLRTAQSRPLSLAGAVIAAVASQVAFATGTLAVLRLLWRRHDLVLTRAESTVLVRRTAIALVSGIAAMVGLALMAFGLRHGVSSSWPTTVLILASVGAAALLVAAPAVVWAARLRPTAPGDRGDIFDDLGPLAPPIFRGRPWRFAVTFAALLGLALAGQGVVASDPYDGILRGIMEMAACLGGFAVLGRYIGLRSAAA